MNSDVCQERRVDRGKVERLLRGLPSAKRIDTACEIFKMLADPNRLRLLYALSREELCVCELAALVEISESAVSHQLRQLRETRLVRNRRAGKMVYYRLDDEHVGQLLQEGLRHAEEV